MRGLIKKWLLEKRLKAIGWQKGEMGLAEGGRL
ncbi:unknown protein [Simkania negevensis Z]|uniref:Uncharacterized protein n=1 Tax=Simkania negevensis (strain ATCC VR-1471 / DSM 27360 / Z) TaxID=331113 RepID=F8L3B7_SIMNZ|nr:unknown protein [Simkania negevensis Z]